ncbi:hypothetical protein HAX54_029297 [Datura stramonium]|uniref:Uncharacterized protein n=1 Tax=Datura stramonium TaxID=4076 RepID=A0ABS8SA61_DATST|nr:hypothetical protein [Datura stramonium]
MANRESQKRGKTKRGRREKQEQWLGRGQVRVAGKVRGEDLVVCDAGGRGERKGYGGCMEREEEFHWGYEIMVREWWRAWTKREGDRGWRVRLLRRKEWSKREEGWCGINGGWFGLRFSMVFPQRFLVVGRGEPGRRPAFCFPMTRNGRRLMRGVWCGVAVCWQVRMKGSTMVKAFNPRTMLSP